MGVSFPGKRKFVAASIFMWPLTVILILLLALAPRSRAQDEQPLIVPRRTIPQGNKKPRGKEPRAVGIVQLNGAKGTLIPVAILINGRFFDASAYKADPVPMALESGTVYELEQAGDSQGLFTVNGALHSKVVGNAHPWVATGSFLPPGKEAAKGTHKAEDVPIGLADTGDEPPRLTRAEPSKSGASSSGGSATPASGGTGKPSGTASAPPSSGGGTSSAGPSASGGSGQDSSKPAAAPAGDKGEQGGKQQGSAQPSAGQSSAAKGANNQSSGAPSGSGSDNNYYRPVLRRGKPATQAPPDEEDTATARKIAETGTTSPSSGAGVDAGKLVAAISDAAGPDPTSYKVFWKTGEEDERRSQMIALAQREVRAYVAALVKNQISAGPVPKSGAVKGKTAAKQPEPVLENVQFHGFDVWLNNEPVMILTAEAKLTSASAGPVAMPESCSVTVVARTDIYGDLQKLYSGVTDKFHLDVTPRLEFIDVVDADGDGRGELLFQETTDVGKGYLIYRATADRLWKMFDSLNVEE
jgi:hypothetical protein